MTLRNAALIVSLIGLATVPLLASGQADRALLNHQSMHR
jgi:hypothetical protein